LLDLWYWITDLGNSKIVALLLFFSLYIGILIYLFGSKKRSERLESYRHMPLDDEDQPAHRDDGKKR
jgi:cbb3-type cytochrome oxidase subunit 3